MSEYRKQAEEANQKWSIMLACALAHAEDVPEDQFAHYLSPNRLEVPAMLYTAMLETVRLSQELVIAMQRGEVEHSQKLVTKLGRINSVLAALPSNQFAGPAPLAHELVDAAVARCNGRWPL